MGSSYLSRTVVGALVSMIFRPAVVAAILVQYSTSFVRAREWTSEWTKWVTVTNGHWGKWGKIHKCPWNHYVTSITVRDEPNQGSGDDSGLNGIMIACEKYGGKKVSVEMELGHWGDWSEPQRCPKVYDSLNNVNQQSYVSSLRAMLEPRLSGDHDDTAINGLKMNCRSVSTGKFPDGIWTGEKTVANHGWGSWTSSATCPKSYHMCGFQQRTEARQGSGDDTAMNGIRMMCCSLHDWNLYK